VFPAVDRKLLINSAQLQQEIAPNHCKSNYVWLMIKAIGGIRGCDFNVSSCGNGHFGINFAKAIATKQQQTFRAPSQSQIAFQFV